MRYILECSYLSMQIFSTCGTSTWSKRIIVCSGSLTRQAATHSGVGFHMGELWAIVVGVIRILPRCVTERLKVGDSDV